MASEPNRGAGEIIRALRKSKRLPQYRLAKMVGVTPGTVANFEKGRRRISLHWLRKIAVALDTPLSYFLDDARALKPSSGGDPRERRLLHAWRRLDGHPILLETFLQLMQHLGELHSRRARKRRVSAGALRNLPRK